MLEKCKVCGGPIANGRCRLCGMPYRDDEVLYHLNENRRDHYRHATINAKAEMRSREIPLGDSPKIPEQKRAPQKTYTPVKRSVPEKKAASEKKYTTEKKRTSAAGAKGKRKTLAAFLIIAVIAAGVISSFEFFAEKFEEARYLGGLYLNDDTYSEQVTAAYSYETDEEISLTVGVHIEPGTYKVYAEAGYADLRLTGLGQSKRYGLTGTQGRDGAVSLSLEDGETVQIIPAQSKTLQITFEPE